MHVILDSTKRKSLFSGLPFILHSPTNCAATHASRRHLSLLVLHDESESVAGDGHDAEGRHEDREVLARLHELAQVLGVLSREESGKLCSPAFARYSANLDIITQFLTQILY